MQDEFVAGIGHAGSGDECAGEFQVGSNIASDRRGSRMLIKPGGDSPTVLALA
jgi:hypothetical protein